MGGEPDLTRSRLVESLLDDQQVGLHASEVGECGLELLAGHRVHGIAVHVRQFLPATGRFALADCSSTGPLVAVTRGRVPVHPFRACVIAAVVAIVAALVLAAAGTAASSYAHVYVDALYLDNGLEAQGVSYNGQKVPVDNASCLGLRRFGVRASDYGLDKFWRFRCTLNGADDHAYDVQLSTTTGAKPRLVYPHYLSVRRLY